MNAAQPALTAEQFEALTPAEQRVAVAKDALQQANAGRFKAGSGWLTVVTAGTTYCTIDQTVLTTKPLSQCYGCALGGAMYSLIRLGNRFEFEEAHGMLEYDEFSERLSEVFPEDQMKLIECAYELGIGFFSTVDLEVDGLDGIGAVDFGDQFDSEHPRFVAIMQNIVDNCGTFVPHVEGA